MIDLLAILSIFCVLLFINVIVACIRNIRDIKDYKCNIKKLAFNLLMVSVMLIAIVYNIDNILELYKLR